MERRHAGKLRGGRREAHPGLRRRCLTVGLQRDAAKAVRVAGGRCGQRSLVAAQERVLRRVAAEIRGADGEVIDEPVARQGQASAFDRGVEAAAGVASRLPPSEGVGAQRGDLQLVVVLHHRRVPIEGRRRLPGSGREAGSNVRRYPTGSTAATGSRSASTSTGRSLESSARARRPGRCISVVPSGSGIVSDSSSLRTPASGTGRRAESSEHFDFAVGRRNDGAHRSILPQGRSDQPRRVPSG